MLLPGCRCFPNGCSSRVFRGFHSPNRQAVGLEMTRALLLTGNRCCGVLLVTFFVQRVWGTIKSRRTSLIERYGGFFVFMRVTG